MESASSVLEKWMDPLFYHQGAFITSHDQKYVLFGKGGSTSRVEHFSSSPDPVFYLKYFFTQQYIAYRPQSTLILPMTEVNEYFKKLASAGLVVSLSHDEDDLYEKDFELLKKSFHQNLKKVVLISRQTYKGFMGAGSVRGLLKKAFTFGSGIPYGIWTPSVGMIGSTPELLYILDGEKMKTFALAGTARIGEEKILLHSKKDLYEHELVIEDIREKLLPLTQNLQVDKTEIATYKSMIHLKTNFEATIFKETSLSDLTSLLSPTAALGGYPKKEAMEFLKKTHYSLKYPERFFGTSFGVLSDDLKQFIVAIRNVAWKEEDFFIESGGGVVPESNFEKELQEIHLKRETIKAHYL